MVVGIVWYWPTSRELQESVGEQYPTGAVAYLRANPPAGPVLNFYLWGGYLGWNDRDFKTFVDSRVDIFEYSGVLQDYLKLLAVNRPDEVLEKYKIRYILFPPSEPLVQALQHDPQWKVDWQR